MESSLQFDHIHNWDGFLWWRRNARMTACDAVDGSSTGIAMCQIAVRFWGTANVAYWHKAEVPPASRDFRFRGLNGHQER
jgi:hypothetical protein